MGNGIGLMVWAELLVIALAGCSSEEEAGPPAWDSCEIEGDACTCVMRAGGAEQSFAPADSCGGYDCCVLHRTDAQTASCMCFDTTESCEDNAGSSSMVVASCPPPGEVLAPTATCVPQGERCPNRSASALEDDPVSGCCEGLLCLSNEEEAMSHPVCQPLGDRDSELAALCERATLTNDLDVEVTQGTLATSRGGVTFDAATFGSARVGPGGCITTVAVQLSGPTKGDAGLEGCQLLLDAVLRDGEWQVRRVLASLDGCAGYTGEPSGSIDVREVSLLPFELSYEGEYCGAEHMYEHHCVSGTFNWHLDGELGDLTFEGSHLIVKGIACGSSLDELCDELAPQDAGR